MPEKMFSDQMHFLDHRHSHGFSANELRKKVSLKNVIELQSSFVGSFVSDRREEKKANEGLTVHVRIRGGEKDKKGRRGKMHFFLHLRMITARPKKGIKRGSKIRLFPGSHRQEGCKKVQHVSNCPRSPTPTDEEKKKVSFRRGKLFGNCNCVFVSSLAFQPCTLLSPLLVGVGVSVVSLYIACAAGSLGSSSPSMSPSTHSTTLWRQENETFRFPHGSDRNNRPPIIYRGRSCHSRLCVCLQPTTSVSIRHEESDGVSAHPHVYVRMYSIASLGVSVSVTWVKNGGNLYGPRRADTLPAKDTFIFSFEFETKQTKEKRSEWTFTYFISVLFSPIKKFYVPLPVASTRSCSLSPPPIIMGSLVSAKSE